MSFQSKPVFVFEGSHWLLLYGPKNIMEVNGN